MQRRKDERKCREGVLRGVVGIVCVRESTSKSKSVRKSKSKSKSKNEDNMKSDGVFCRIISFSAVLFILSLVELFQKNKIDFFFCFFLLLLFLFSDLLTLWKD